MTRTPLLCLVSFSFVLIFGNPVQAQQYQVNNGFAGVYPGSDHSYQGPRTDPRLGYCLEHDCFAGQGPNAHKHVIYGGGNGCGQGGYGNRGCGSGHGNCSHCGNGGSDTRIRVTIYPGSPGVPPVVQTSCVYCGASPAPGVYVRTSANRPATPLPANAIPSPVGKSRSYKYKF